ncbi:preprotein translocase subunit SecE [Nakamurella sp. A5-74]|uniref:Protein translocase subunit SecE n=1 Tax=Nakamurella sp. A5-74 TaxID=3158264 RepID=A0AAU8DTA6_9ACTN
MSNEHDDVGGTPEDDLSTRDAGADATPSSETVGTTAGSHPMEVDAEGDPVDADLPVDDSVDADATADEELTVDEELTDDEELTVDADGELVAVGAAAGSARAAARRSAVRSGVTDKKGRATLARDSDRGEKQANVFQRLGRFLREVVAELRKVIWPHRKQLITYTTVVLVFVVFMTALVFGLDALFARGVLAVFGGG